ncbi:MAG: glycosyltransferase family 2 protein [Flavipsychrobacter sp.]|nr:glycosyltransferase family 2 protein [Flavipsychrobacter sp.]
MNGNEHPLVTVLMPAYNAGPYIGEAIDSVLQQTYRDFELLVINDGSKDDTAKILESYTDPRMKVVHQENMGLVRTLNKGLAIAKGEFIARFDADDVCYPERLEEQMAFLQAHPDYVAISSEADYMDEAGNFIFTYKFKYYEDDEIRAAGFKLCPVIHSAVTFRKQAVLDAGGYDPNAITFEDHLLWRNLAQHGKMKNVRKSHIKVRFNPDSVTIDEKWRGKEFLDLKARSIQQGFVTDEDAALLKEILRKQNFAEYKKAAYYSMMGKKFLWNQHNATQARAHLVTAIKAQPQKLEPYFLFALSFLPASVLDIMYKKLKG